MWKEEDKLEEGKWLGEPSSPARGKEDGRGGSGAQLGPGRAGKARFGAICSLHPPWPLRTPFLLSREVLLKRQTRSRILEREARGRRPKRQGQGGVGGRACAGRCREERAERQKGKRQPGTQESPRGQVPKDRMERKDRDLS